MRLKVEKLMEGPGPSEALVEVKTCAGGFVEVIVHDSAIRDETIEIGNPIYVDVEADKALVELPREAMSGTWRVWVPRRSVT